MLTKDLLQFKNSGKNIKPIFVDENNPALLDFSQQLLAIYIESIGKTRSELNELTDLVIQGSDHLTFAKSINKILSDRSEFSLPKAEDPATRRALLLKKSADLLRNKDTQRYEDFRQELLTSSTVSQPLYADLPEYEQLQKVKSITPLQLLQRLNMHQVQGLLMSANKLNVTLTQTNATELRRVLKFLKFFRLLVSMRKKNDTVILDIDGPLSILDGSRKYGLQMASFFPIICHLTQWQISAEVKPKRSVKTLKLDQHSELVCHYRNMSTYIPQEVRMFAEHFKKTVDDWQFLPDTPWFTLERGRLIFPDFTLRHSCGKIVYLEIFHRWHKGELLQRIEDIKTIDGNYILAIDRYLLKGKLAVINDDFPEEIPALDAHQHFLFTDYPSVSRLQKCLTLWL